MRRAALLLYIVGFLLLSGCKENHFSSRRDIDRIRPVQTIGLDRRDNGVVLSVSTGIGPDKDPALVMTAGAGSIEAAIDRIQEYSPEDELFYAHVRYILLGESMAEGGITSLVDWVARSPSMRLGTPVFLVKNGAEAAVAGAQAESTDITERLAALEREELVRGCHICTLREIASALMDRGCVLCPAVESAASTGVIVTAGESDTAAVLPRGYAVLTDDRLAGYLTEEETLGSELILWGLNGVRTEIEGNMLDLLSGRCEITGVREEDGTLAEIRIDCVLRTGVLEEKAGEAWDPARLEEALQAAAEGWIEAAVARSRAMGLDYLALGDSLLRDTPFFRRSEAARRDDPLGDIPVTVRVQAWIDRSYDLAGAEL